MQQEQRLAFTAARKVREGKAQARTSRSRISGDDHAVSASAMPEREHNAYRRQARPRRRGRAPAAPEEF